MDVKRFARDVVNAKRLTLHALACVDVLENANERITLLHLSYVFLKSKTKRKKYITKCDNSNLGIDS